MCEPKGEVKEDSAQEENGGWFVVLPAPGCKEWLRDAPGEGTAFAKDCTGFIRAVFDGKER